ncbi:MAG: hypothetical protein H6727_01635 [Myxococcales bacterium]|nr:hypothetical protein [Myxococcales bacterium]
MKRFAEVTFRKAGQAYLFSYENITLGDFDKVIVETEHGLALGTVKRVYELSKSPPPSMRIFPVLRVATPEDVDRAKHHRVREGEAFRFCRERIDAHKLPMKMVRTEHLYSGSKMIFYFSAEGRIDFRGLVRDLARHFRMRIEMRQIGVRDSAKLIGGVGPCGQELCCSRFLRNFSPVSIRMAKDQSLALNPQKVSGVCGRLMCCLSYEQSVYKQLRRSLPKVGRDVVTPEGEGKVREVHPLRESVRVIFLNRDPIVEKEFHVSELPEYSEAFAQDDSLKNEFANDGSVDFSSFDNFDERGQSRIKGRRGIEPLMEPRNLPPPSVMEEDDDIGDDDEDGENRSRRRQRNPRGRGGKPERGPSERDGRPPQDPKDRGPQDGPRPRRPQGPVQTRVIEPHARGPRPPRSEQADPSVAIEASPQAQANAPTHAKDNQAPREADGNTREQEGASLEAGAQQRPAGRGDRRPRGRDNRPKGRDSRDSRGGRPSSEGGDVRSSGPRDPRRNAPQGEAPRRNEQEPRRNEQEPRRNEQEPRRDKAPIPAADPSQTEVKAQSPEEKTENNERTNKRRRRRRRGKGGKSEG